MTTEYCGIFKVTYADHTDHTDFLWTYSLRDSPTEAKKFFLTYQESENNVCESFSNDRRIELVHIANSECLHGAELLRQYKEEVGC